MKAIRHTHPYLWLIAAIAMTLLSLGIVTELPTQVEIIASIGLSGVAAFMLLQGRYDAGEQSGDAPGPWRGAGTLVSKMAPTVMLMLTFPLVITTVNTMQIGGVPTGPVLLAVSVSVPWLSQAVCTSFYRHFWDLDNQRSTKQVATRMFHRWPEILLATLPVSIGFTVAIGLITHWPPVTMAYVGAGMFLHSLFAQSQVLVNQTRNNALWVLSWTLYSLTILMFPTYWLLAPVAGTLPNIVIIATGGTSVHRPTLRELGQHITDAGRGFLTGSVLWADKFVLLLLAGTVYDVFNLYVALIPAILAYSYYFAQLAPNFDLAVVKADKAIHRGDMAELRRRTARVSDIVTHAVARTLAVATVIALTMTALLRVIDGPRLPLELIVTPIAALMVTIIAYQLEYIGHLRTAAALSGLHLLAILSFAVVAPTIAFPLVLGIDVALLLFGVVRIRQVWGSMPYQMFWRFATQW